MSHGNEEKPVVRLLAHHAPLDYIHWGYLNLISKQSFKSESAANKKLVRHAVLFPRKIPVTFGAFNSFQIEI